VTGLVGLLVLVFDAVLLVGAGVATRRQRLREHQQPPRW
jgi:hypothetical protein